MATKREMGQAQVLLTGALAVWHQTVDPTGSRFETSDSRTVINVTRHSSASVALQTTLAQKLPDGLIIDRVCSLLFFDT